MSKRLIAGLAVAALVLAGFVGGVLLGSPNASQAQEDSTTTTVPDVTAVPATPGWIQDALDGLVADGVITQAQADAVADALQSAKPFDRGMMGGREGHFRGDLSAVATAIGIDEATLMTDLHDGQTLAEIAEANGKTAQVVIDALVADAKAHLDGEVTEGDLTQEEADARLDGLTTAITAMVNGEAPPGGPGFGFGGRGHHGHGFGGPGMMHPDDSTTDIAPTASNTSL